MKKSKYTIVNGLFAAMFLVMLVSACKKELNENLGAMRMFMPGSFDITSGETQVKLEWAPSLYKSSTDTTVTYTVEVSKDSTFQSPIEFSVVTDTSGVTFTDDSLSVRQKYFARVKANMQGDSPESKWNISPGFSIRGVQIFSNLQESDIIDDAVILRWTPTSGVSKVVITPVEGTASEVPVTEAENVAGNKQVKNLMPGTSYTAEIFAGTKSKGIISFQTKAPVVADNIIDLRGIENRPEVLVDTLPLIPSGSTVLLARGAIYTVPSAYVFDKAVTIRSGLGFGDPAKLSLANNFDATGTIDSLSFQDVAIVQAGASYFMNIGGVATIGKITFENCTTQGVFSNSFIRMKTSGDVVSKLIINNCVLDSIGIASKYALIYAGSGTVFTNIEVSNSTFYSFYYFLREDNSAPANSLLINNCTFNDMINQGGYFVNYKSVIPSSFNISNCIFGKTIDPTNSNWIKSSQNPVVSNSYFTSDCVFSGNPVFNAAAYSKVSTDLFNDPTNGDFTIKDSDFDGKNNTGDPRWRPQL